MLITEWHYCLIGPKDSPFANGYYHGTLIFTKDYPFKPPTIYCLTPNGRYVQSPLFICSKSRLIATSQLVIVGSNQAKDSAYLFPTFIQTPGEYSHWLTLLELSTSIRFQESCLECLDHPDWSSEYNAGEHTDAWKLRVDDLREEETCYEFPRVQPEERSVQVSIASAFARDNCRNFFSLSENFFLNSRRRSKRN